MGLRFIEFARFFRNILEARDLSTRQVFMLCEERVPLYRIYAFLRGERVPVWLELALLQQRLNISIPWRYLRGEDRYGTPIKDRQLVFAGVRK